MVVQRDAPGEAIDVLPVLHRAVRLGWRALEAPCPAAGHRVGPRNLGAVLREILGSREPGAPCRAAAPRLARQRRVARDVADARFEVDLGTGRDLQIRAHARLPPGVVRLGPLVARPAGGREIAQDPGAAAQARRIVVERAGAEHRRTAGILRLDDVHRPDDAKRVAPVVRRNPALRVHEPVPPLPDGEAVARPARGALFGDDVDHAARRLRAVQRRGRRPFENLDALDLRRIEVVEARHDARAERLHGHAGAGLAIHAHPVHVDQGFARQGERGHAAHADFGAAPDHPGPGHHHHARRAAVDEALHVGDGCGRHHGVGIDRGDGITERTLLLPARRPRDHDLVQLDRPIGERQPDVRGADRHRPRRRTIPDQSRGERDLSAAHAGEPKPTRHIGRRLLPRLVRDANLDVREGTLGSLGDDHTRDVAFLLLLRDRRCRDEREQGDGVRHDVRHGLPPPD